MAAQRFVLGRRLGAGGMGTVHVATDTRFDRPVALKMMSGHLAPSAEFRERFLREADVLTRLSSPHVTTIYDHGEDDGSLWIATQLVTGGDLGNLLRERGPLPPRLAVRVCRQVAEALRAAHEVGVLHRDVKPANVLVRDPDAPQLHVYLCDFGIADTGSDRLTVAGGVAGTWQYLSPERGAGSPAAPTTDVYAVGCLLWTCLTGRPPYGGSDVDIAIGHLEGAIPQVPEGAPGLEQLNEVLRTALAKNPRERYQSAAELRAALAGVEDTLPATLPPLALPDPGSSRVSPASQPAGRRRRLVAAGVAGAALVAGGAGLAVVLGGSDADSGPGGTADQPTTEAVTGDVDGDGLGDVVVSDWNSSTPRLALLRSTRTSFEDATEVATDSTAIRGDIDGDGTEELITVEVGGADTIPLKVHDLDGGDHTLDVANDGFTGYVGEGAVLADVTGDGRDDFVSAVDTESGDGFEVWMAESRGDSFSELTLVHTSSDPIAHVRAADVDGDDDEDILLVGHEGEKIDVLTFDAGELTASGLKSTNTLSGDLHTGDADGDGVDEVIEIDSNDRILVLRFDGNAWDHETWLTDTEQAWHLGNPNPDSTLADVDGDGDDDIVRFSDGEGPDPRTVQVFLSTGTAYEPPADWGTYTCECDDFFDPVNPFYNR